MKDTYKTRRLYAANFGMISNNSVGIPNVNKYRLKYLFEKIETNKGVKYVEVFKGYTIYEYKEAGYYRDLPYLENITPLKDLLPYVSNTVRLEDLLLIMKAINVKDTSRNMVYIDFDGVILDTEEELFREWRKNQSHHLLPESTKIEYIANTNWDYVLNNSRPINNAITYLNKMDITKTFILTKVHSLANEGSAKVKWCRENGIKQNIILVPYNVKKSDIVNANNNILIDDCIKNLNEWEHEGGKGILFDADDDNFDSWHVPNNKPYQKVLDLKNFVK